MTLWDSYIETRQQLRRAGIGKRRYRSAFSFGTFLECRLSAGSYGWKADRRRAGGRPVTAGSRETVQPVIRCSTLWENGNFTGIASM